MAVLHSRPPPSSLSSISVLQERESKTVAATLERVQTQHRNKARLLRTLTERQAALKKERAQKARPPSSLRFVSAQLAQRKACLKWVAPMLSVAGCHLWSQGEEADQRLEAEHMKWKGLRRETSLLETEALVARATLELESNNLAARLDSEKTMCIRLKTDIEQLETQLQRLKRKQQDNPQLKALQEEQEQRLLDLAKVRHPRHAACLLPPPFECCLWPPTPNVLSRSPGAPGRQTKRTTSCAHGSRSSTQHSPNSECSRLPRHQHPGLLLRRHRCKHPRSPWSRTHQGRYRPRGGPLVHLRLHLGDLPFLAALQPLLWICLVSSILVVYKARITVVRCAREGAGKK